MIEAILIVVVLLGVGGLGLTCIVFLKNRKLKAKLESQRREHIVFAERFRAVSDVEAEAKSVKQKLHEEKDALEAEIVEVKKRHQLEDAALAVQTATAKAEHESFLKEQRERRAVLESQFQRARQDYKKLKDEVGLLEEHLDDVSFGLYEPHFTFDTAEDYKTELKDCRDRQRTLIRNKSATRSPGNWTVNESRTEGKKMERQYTKVMLRAFNGECDAAVAKVTWNNATKMVQRIEKAYADINKLGAVMKMSISPEYLKEKLNEVRLTHEYQDKKHQEREEQREQRAQIREQERTERELAKAEAEADREERIHRRALEKARSEADAATGEQLKKLTAQIAALELKVGEAHTRKERAIARAQLTRSGFVYVLSNRGSFGEGVVKIGMTRRMEPLDRVKELGDASVPFPFDVHVMMFSENAPELERALHDHFEDRRVNLVNRRKEYFRNVSLDEVEDIIRAKGVTAQFTSVPEAREFRETQAAVRAKSDAIAEEESAVPTVLFTGDEIE